MTMDFDLVRFRRYSTRNWTDIIIHYSYSPDNAKTYQWGNIDWYHTIEKGWSEIGYHFGFEKVKGVYNLCVGRGLNKGGGHTIGMNDKAIGICCIGKFDDNEPEDALYEAVTDLLVALCLEFNISVSNISPHSKYADYKTCPGRKFDMEKLRGMVNTQIDYKNLVKRSNLVGL